MSKTNVLKALLICFIVPSLFSQSGEERDFSAIIQDLQNRFEVQFNYASELAENTILAAPDSDLKLRPSLEYLEKKLNLRFEFLSPSVISIFRKTTICGRILDKNTGEPLPYATVQTEKKGTITDEWGYFEMELPKTARQLQVHHIGHRSLYRSTAFLSKNDCADLYLIARPEELEEVIIYDYIIRGMAKSSEGSYDIDFKRMGLLPGLIDDDVLQTVQVLPGIQSVDETVSNINIRGGSNDQNLFLWDGIKMYQSGHFFGLISMYNPYITKNVSLKKNGSSAGMTDGVSGTIAMATENYIDPDTKGGISINLLDAAGFSNIALSPKSSLKVAARKSISDFVDTPTFSSYFDRIAQNTEVSNAEENASGESDIGFDYYDTALRLLYRPSEKDRIRANVIYVSNELNFTENPMTSSFGQGRESMAEQNSLGFGLFYTRQWNSSIHTDIEIYNTDYRLRAVNANVERNQRFLQENTVSETGAKLSISSALGENSRFSNGLQLFETKVTNLDDVDEPRFIDLQGNVLRTYALWSELSLLAPNKQTRANIGLRYNYLDKFQKQLIEPRIGINHKISKKWDAELLGEFKHQSTSQLINFQTDFLGLEKRRWQLADEVSVPVITSRQVSLGLNFNDRGWLASTAGYYKKVYGITTQSQGFTDLYQFARTSGDYASYGADVLLRKEFKKSAVWACYTFLNSTYYFDELPETEFQSNFNITNTLCLGANKEIGKFRLAGSMNYRSGKPFTGLNETEPVTDGSLNYNAANEERQKPFFRTDISTSYKMDIKEIGSLRLAFSIWNVLNRKNVLNTTFAANSADTPIRREQLSLGLTPNFSLRFQID